MATLGQHVWKRDTLADLRDSVEEPVEGVSWRSQSGHAHRSGSSARSASWPVTQRVVGPVQPSGTLEKRVLERPSRKAAGSSVEVEPDAIEHMDTRLLGTIVPPPDVLREAI
jgi:hypothetical protein